MIVNAPFHSKFNPLARPHALGVPLLRALFEFYYRAGASFKDAERAQWIGVGGTRRVISQAIKRRQCHLTPCDDSFFAF